MHIEPDDICFNKAAIIERSIRRIREEYEQDPELQSFTHLDALILNMERACQAAIDLAMHVTAKYHLGIPQNSGDAFALLGKSGILKYQTVRAMVGMTGFRNIAIHEYQKMEMSVVHFIAREGWMAWVVYCEELGIHIAPRQSGI